MFGVVVYVAWDAVVKQLGSFHRNPNATSILAIVCSDTKNALMFMIEHRVFMIIQLVVHNCSNHDALSLFVNKGRLINDKCMS